MKRWIAYLWGGVLLAALVMLLWNRNPQQFDVFSLQGKWQDVAAESTHIEEWIKKGDNHLLGKGFVLSKRDTVYIEMLEILEVNDTLQYIARVSNQNQNEAVHFQLKSWTKNEIVFENPSHDFPQRIGYRLKDDSNLEAYIEGEKDGKNQRSVFDFVRILEE